MSNEYFDINQRRMMLYRKKKRRKLLKLCYFSTLGLILLVSLVISIVTNLKNNVSHTTTVKKDYSETISTSDEIPFKVCIDPGHGADDVGTEGITGSYEKDIVLSVSLKLGNLLKENGITVVYTRVDDNIPWSSDANTSLKERLKVSKYSNVDVFVSIHCNSDYTALSAKGPETWYTADDTESKNFASYLQYYLSELHYSYDRGIKTYSDPEDALAVLEKNDNTAALVELGFLSNEEDEIYLKSDSGQTACAQALCDAIIDYKNTYFK